MIQMVGNSREGIAKNTFILLSTYLGPLDILANYLIISH